MYCMSSLAPLVGVSRLQLQLQYQNQHWIEQINHFTTRVDFFPLLNTL